jgi:hypothetical protein
VAGTYFFRRSTGAVLCDTETLVLLPFDNFCTAVFTARLFTVPVRFESRISRFFVAGMA